MLEEGHESNRYRNGICSDKEVDFHIALHEKITNGVYRNHV